MQLFCTFFYVRIVCSYLMIWKFVYVKTALYPLSHIFTMEISELCVRPSRIWPSMDVPGICSNTYIHSLVDTILPPFGSPTVIREMLNVFCLLVSLGLIQFLPAPVSTIPVLGSTIFGGVHLIDFT